MDVTIFCYNVTFRFVRLLCCVTSLTSLLMLLYSRNGCNLILLKLSVFLDKGNDAENLKPSSGVLSI